MSNLDDKIHLNEIDNYSKYNISDLEQILNYLEIKKKLLNKFINKEYSNKEECLNLFNMIYYSDFEKLIFSRKDKNGNFYCYRIFDYESRNYFDGLHFSYLLNLYQKGYVHIKKIYLYNDKMKYCFDNDIDEESQNKIETMTNNDTFFNEILPDFYEIILTPERLNSDMKYINREILKVSLLLKIKLLKRKNKLLCLRNNT